MLRQSIPMTSALLGGAVLALAGLAQARGTPATPDPDTAAPDVPFSSHRAAPAEESSATTSRGSSSGVGTDRFGQLDTNRDGFVDQSEAKADRRLNRQFGKVDSNRDGRLDQAEFSAFETGGVR